MSSGGKEAKIIHQWRGGGGTDVVLKKKEVELMLVIADDVNFFC